MSAFTELVSEIPVPRRKEGKALTGPEGSRRFRLPDFKTVDTLRW